MAACSTLERGLNDKAVTLRTVITVDETRETISFFGYDRGGGRLARLHRRHRRRTQSERGQRAAQGPRRAAAPIAVPAGQPLAGAGAADHSVALPQIAVAAAFDRRRRLPRRSNARHRQVDANDPALVEAAEASEGSVSRALTLLGGDALKLQQRTAALLATLPKVDPRELHALGDALGTSDRVALAAFIDSVDRWIGEKLRAGDANANLPRLARLAEVWEKIVRAARDTEAYNLERKPLVFSVFGLLAEATR